MRLGIIDQIEAHAPVAQGDRPAAELRVTVRPGLAVRLALIAAVAVFLTALLVQLPMIGQQRSAWLADRVAAAIGIDAMIDEVRGGSSSAIPRLLENAGLRAIILQGSTSRRQHVIEPLVIGSSLDLRQTGWAGRLVGALSTFAALPHDTIHVIDTGPAGYDTIEILVEGSGLREALEIRAVQILTVCASIALVCGVTVFLMLRHFVARPLHRLSRNIAGFADDPERVENILIPSARTDEIGAAERALVRLQVGIGGELRRRQHLAALGLSVCKVNHELRNLLSTAQLLGNRLEAEPGPAAQKVARRLAETIDRAIRFCEATLTYGRAAEPVPVRRMVPLTPLLEELVALAGLAKGPRISIDISSASDLRIDADPEQLSRALTNLVRNAVQALDTVKPPIPAPEVRLAASRKGAPGSGEVTIFVSDNGPGLPKEKGASLLAPFPASTRTGGAGLGLAIAAELVRLNGGSLRLERSSKGACFRITIPDRAESSAHVA